jgi:drug/metabolite transporter (DMT)-like permease
MNRSRQAELALLFCSLVWGATYVLVKIALENASVFVFLLLRCVIGAVALALIYRIALRRLDRRVLAAGVVLGSLRFAGYAFQTIGIHLTTPSKAAFITGSSVVMVPILHGWFGRRRIGAWVWAGALTAFAGLYFLTVPATGLSGLNRGDLWVLGCAVFWALHIIAIGHYSPRHSVGALSFADVLTTASLSAVFLPLLWVTNLQAPRLVWTRSLVFAVVVAAVGATAIAYSLQVWAQRFTAPAHVAIIFSLEPVFAALTSFAFYGERFTRRGLVGAAIVLAGILLAELKRTAPSAPESAVAPTTSAAD